VPVTEIIELGNSYSAIKGLKAELLTQLQKLLSYDPAPDAKFYRGFPAKRKSMVDKYGHFPTGLLPHVTKFLELKAATFTVHDTRIKPQKAACQELPGAPVLYPAQNEAVQAALAKKRGGVVMPTGTGKTLVIATLVAELGVPTLIVVPSLEVKKQFEDALKTFFDKKSLEGVVRVENIDSTILSKLKGFQCLIIDECHHAAAKTYQKLNKSAWNDIYYRFFFSATYFRNDDNQNLLFEGIAGEIAYTLEYTRAVRDKYIVPVEAYSISLPKKQVTGATWKQVYNELVVKNDLRNLKISYIMKDLLAVRRPTLCLVKEIAHGKELSAITGVPFVNGQDEESRGLISQFNSGNLTSLIGTTGVLGEGVDTKPCEYVIIAGLGKAKSAFMQQVGRAVRTYPGKESAKVIVFKDPSHKWALAHFNAQRKILLDEYGVKVEALEIWDKGFF